MADQDTLQLTNGPNTPDLKFHLEVNGRIEEAGGRGQITDTVADTTKTYHFRGVITEFRDIRGAGSAEINGESFRFQDLEGYDTRGGGSNNNDRPPEPKTPPKRETPEDASGEWTPPTSDGERDLNPAYGIVNRPAVSTCDRTITVGENGDVGTVQAAMNQLPRAIEHEFTIELEKGRHANEPGDSINVPPITVAAAYSGVKLVGDKDAPENYVLDVRQANFQFLSGTAQNSAIEGVTITGTIQNRFGLLELDSCVVAADERWGADLVALDTYSGTVQCLSTRLESPGAAMNFVEDATITLNSRCSIDADGPVCTSGQGGGLLSIGGDIDVACNGKLTQGWEPAGVRAIDTHGALDGLENGPAGIRLG